MREEQVHLYFKASYEFAKLLHQAAFVSELVVVLLAVHGLLSNCILCLNWQPLAIVGTAFIAMLSRSLAHHVELFSNDCRRDSLLAFALGKEIEPRLFFEIQSAVPLLIKTFGKRLPANSLTLMGYYQSSCPPGPARLREIYAHSSFYNWRLQRTYCWLATFVGVSLLIAGFILTFILLISPPPEEVRATLLEGFYSVVLAFVAFRALQKAFRAHLNLISMKRTFEALLAEPPPEGELLQDIILRYEVVRAQTIMIPTLLYRFRRDRLEQEWLERRAALGCDRKELSPVLMLGPQPHD